MYRHLILGITGFNILRLRAYYIFGSFGRRTVWRQVNTAYEKVNLTPTVNHCGTLLARVVFSRAHQPIFPITLTISILL